MVGLVGCVLLGHPAAANQLYFAMPTNYDGQEADTVFVYGVAGTSGTVVSPGGFNTGFTVGANGVASITIPSSLDLTTSGQVTNNGFIVSTTNPSANVGASYLSREQFTTDSTYLLNSTALGTSYYALGGPGISGVGQSQLSIVGTAAGTTVTVTPSVALTGGHAAGVPFDVTLGAGQAVLFTATGSADVTGTRVVSSAPVAVFGGSQIADVPATSFAGDHLITAVPSTDQFTSAAVIPTTKGTEGNSSNIVRVVAATNGTIVSYAGQMVTTLDAGQFFDFRSGAGGLVTASSPILIGEFLTGQSEHDSTPGDPSLSYIPGITQWLKDYLFSTPVGSQAYTDNFLDLALSTADIPSLRLNGLAVSASACTALTGTGAA